jgi:hypothetical protein
LFNLAFDVVKTAAMALHLRNADGYYTRGPRAELTSWCGITRKDFVSFPPQGLDRLEAGKLYDKLLEVVADKGATRDLPARFAIAAYETLKSPPSLHAPFKAFANADERITLTGLRCMLSAIFVATRWIGVRKGFALGEEDCAKMAAVTAAEMMKNDLAIGWSTMVSRYNARSHVKQSTDLGFSPTRAVILGERAQAYRPRPAAIVVGLPPATISQSPNPTHTQVMRGPGPNLLPRSPQRTGPHPNYTSSGRDVSVPTASASVLMDRVAASAAASLNRRAHAVGVSTGSEYLSKMLNGWNMELEKGLATLDRSLEATSGQARTNVESGLWGADRAVIYTLAGDARLK